MRRDLPFRPGALRAGGFAADAFRPEGLACVAVAWAAAGAGAAGALAAGVLAGGSLAAGASVLGAAVTRVLVVGVLAGRSLAGDPGTGCGDEVPADGSCVMEPACVVAIRRVNGNFLGLWITLAKSPAAQVSLDENWRRRYRKRHRPGPVHDREGSWSLWRPRSFAIMERPPEQPRSGDKFHDRGRKACV